MLVAVGDIACGPDDTRFSGGDPAACQMRATAQLATSLAPSYVLHARRHPVPRQPAPGHRAVPGRLPGRVRRVVGPRRRHPARAEGAARPGQPRVRRHEPDVRTADLDRAQLLLLLRRERARLPARPPSPRRRTTGTPTTSPSSTARPGTSWPSTASARPCPRAAPPAGVPPARRWRPGSRRTLPRTRASAPSPTGTSPGGRGAPAARSPIRSSPPCGRTSSGTASSASLNGHEPLLPALGADGRGRSTGGGRGLGVHRRLRRRQPRARSEQPPRGRARPERHRVRGPRRSPCALRRCDYRFTTTGGAVRDSGSLHLRQDDDGTDGHGRLAGRGALRAAAPA